MSRRASLRLSNLKSSVKNQTAASWPKEKTHETQQRSMCVGLMKLFLKLGFQIPVSAITLCCFIFKYRCTHIYTSKPFTYQMGSEDYRKKKKEMKKEEMEDLIPPSSNHHSCYQWCSNKEKKIPTLWQHSPSVLWQTWPYQQPHRDGIVFWICPNGDKPRLEFHHVCHTFQHVCVDKGFVWHRGASNRGQAGDETFRALSSGMLKEEEEEGLRGIGSWQERIVKRWRWP